MKAIARKLRVDILEMITKAASGHTGGSLSIADLVTLLYFEEMHIDPANPKMADRDRLVLSKGHAAPAMYAALAEKGYFDKEELNHLRQAGHMLQGHPDMKHTPGVDMTTGSLGQGISAACGMALASQMITSITPSPNESTEDKDYYDGYGTPTTDVTSAEH